MAQDCMGIDIVTFQRLSQNLAMSGRAVVTSLSRALIRKEGLASSNTNPLATGALYSDARSVSSYGKMAYGLSLYNPLKDMRLSTSATTKSIYAPITGGAGRLPVDIFFDRQAVFKDRQACDRGEDAQEGGVTLADSPM